MHRAFWGVAAATVGVLLGHQVTYERLPAQAPGHEGMTMASQSWLPSWPAALVVVSLLAFLAALVARYIPHAVSSTRFLLVGQTVAFVAIEVLDRFINECCLFPAWHVAALGLAAQLLPAAAILAVLAVAVPYVVSAVTHSLGYPSSFVAPRPVVAHEGPVVLRDFLRTVLLPVRGPPSRFVATTVACV